MDIKERKKQARIQINDIFERHCKYCEHGSKLNSEKFEICSSCPQGIKLRELGQIILLPKPKKEKPKKTEVLKMTVNKLESFTVEEYNQLKEHGLTDRQIIDRKNTTIGYLQKWKRKNGIIGTCKQDFSYTHSKTHEINTESTENTSQVSEVSDETKTLIEENKSLKERVEVLQQENKHYQSDVLSLRAELAHTLQEKVFGIKPLENVKEALQAILGGERVVCSSDVFLRVQRALECVGMELLVDSYYSVELYKETEVTHDESPCTAIQ